MTTTTDHNDLRTTYSYVKCSKKITKVLVVLKAPPNNAHTPNPCYRAQRALSLAQSNLTSTSSFKDLYGTHSLMHIQKHSSDIHHVKWLPLKKR